MSAENPADTVIKQAARVIQDSWTDEDEYGAPGDMARALHTAGLLADPADRDYWRELVRHAEASESWERSQKERAEAEVAELRATVQQWEAAHDKLLTDHATATNAVDRVREVHQSISDEDCEHDGYAWPCPTIRALDTAGGEQHDK